MPGPQLALAVVGVLAAVALLGVVVLLVQLRSLRRQLTAAQAGAATTAEPQQAPAPPQMPALIEPDPPSSREIARRDDISWLDIGGTALVRVAAMTHGVRQALAPANRDRIAALVRRDLRRRERLRRRAARRAARVLPIEAAHALPPAAAGTERRDIAS
jgi:hypothetical protein